MYSQTPAGHKKHHHTQVQVQVHGYLRNAHTVFTRVERADRAARGFDNEINVRLIIKFAAQNMLCYLLWVCVYVTF